MTVTPLVRDAALNSPRDLAQWLADELSHEPPDVRFMVRVLARETDRWLTSELAPDDLATLVATSASTGDQRWDALLEGLTAYRCSQLGMPRPEWTNKTSLAAGWNPYDDTDNPPDVNWAMLDTLETPVFILEKGVTFSRRNLWRR